MIDFKPLVAKEKTRIINDRRSLHRIPETAFTEHKTAAFLKEQLVALGLDVDTGIAGTGIVAHLNGEKKSDKKDKTLLIRADMDALAIEEDTGLSFSSTHKGQMHACGHDGHMAMALGAARLLTDIRDNFSGRVKFVFQPAEEGPGGAKPMIDAGVMEDPVVDFALGAHLWPALRRGQIGIKEGPLMAAMDFFDITLTGKGGHGAMPHLCVDPIDAGVQVINSLQRIVSRQMSPISPAVVTVSSFHGGSSHNIIPETVALKGTTRTFDKKIWVSWQKRMETIIAGICQAAGVDYTLTYTPGYPPTINDKDMAAIARDCAREMVPDDRVVEPEPTMGGEDMSFFLEKAKGCYIFLGTGREGGAPLHNARFDYDESVLLTGVEFYCRMTLKLLG